MLPPSSPVRSPPPAPGQPVRRLRRSLSVPALAIHCSGQPAAAAQLREALAVPPMPADFAEAERPVVEAALGPHLFHSFAARTHPLLVRQLLRDLAPGEAVLDPFCGSGTVPLEVVLAGGRAFGCDVNELAVRLARFKATALPPAMQRALLNRAEVVAAASLERVRKRERPRRSWDDPAYYPPHIYLELCGLREEVEQVVRHDAPLGEALLLILSSLVIKLSTQRAESRPHEVTAERHLGKGLPTRLFLRKAQEVCRLHAALWSHLPSPPPPAPRLVVADARAGVGAALALAAASLDRVITSPPYLGTYDYASHHARRYAWLGIDPTPIERGEMAARRHGESLPLPELQRRHESDCRAWVSAVARLLKPGGRLYILVGDSMVGDLLVDGAAPLLDAGRAAGLALIARAAAERPHYLRPGADPPPRPRHEHLLYFTRPGNETP